MLCLVILYASRQHLDLFSLFIRQNVRVIHVSSLSFIRVFFRLFDQSIVCRVSMLVRSFVGFPSITFIYSGFCLLNRLWDGCLNSSESRGTFCLKLLKKKKRKNKSKSKIPLEVVLMMVIFSSTAAPQWNDISFYVCCGSSFERSG